MEEKWVPVMGHVGYEVSSLGQVKSLDREIVTKSGVKKRVKGRLLKPGTTSNGYQLVVLNKKSRLVHHLVMEAFVGPRPPQADIRHWPDTDKSNNRLDNLSYGTRHENIMDSVAAGTWNNRNTGKTRCIRGHEFTPENTYISVRRGKEERQCVTCRRTYRERQRALKR